MTTSKPAEERGRYPGTRPFDDTREDAAKFFGRDEETAEIYLRVLSVPFLVQFGKSGLGKTSLLQAGLCPRLRRQAYLPVMIRLNLERESLADAVSRAIRESCAAEKLAFTLGPPTGLWELLSDFTAWRNGLLLTPVLIFDQFEEVFTLRNRALRTELVAELGALATGQPPLRMNAPAAVPPDVKIVISLREEYLGALEEFSAAIPGLFRERLRLEPMRQTSAQSAITAPALLEPPPGEPPYDSPMFEFEPAALDAMIEYLEGESGIIEPFQLQLLCRHAEKIATKKSGSEKKKVTLTLKGDFHDGRDFRSVLDNFYRDTLAKIPRGIQRRRAARLCEERLLGDSGHRLMVEERQILNEFGIAEKTLNTLVRERLLRSEPRQKSVFYEISHDRLAESIFAARRLKVPRNVKRWLWAVAALVLLCFLGFAACNRAVSNELQRADALITFLLGEQFIGELRDTGRSSLLELVQDRADKAGASGANQGLAHRNRGDIDFVRGHVAAAYESYEQALSFLGDSEPAVVREAARTHDRLGATWDARGDVTKALKHYQKSAALWRSVIDTNAVAEDCVSLAEVLTETASARSRTGRAADTLADLEKATAILSSILFRPTRAEDKCRPTPAVDAFPDAKAVEVLSKILTVRANLLVEIEDFEAAAALGKAASDLRPPSVSARQQAFVTLAMRGASRRDTDPPAALKDNRKALEDADVLRQWDPKNRLWLRERAANQILIAEGILACLAEKADCGPDTSMETAEFVILDSIASIRGLVKADPQHTSLVGDLVWALRTYARIAAETNRNDVSLKYLAEAESLAKVDPKLADALRAHEYADLLSQKAAMLESSRERRKARAALREASAIYRALTAGSDDPRLLSSFAAVREQEAELARKEGDPAAADAAAREVERLMDRALGFMDTLQKRLERLAQSHGSRSMRGDQLIGQKDFAAAVRELEAAEAAALESVRARPGNFAEYRRLLRTYKTMHDVHQQNNNDAAQREVLRVWMNAAQLAAWLAPEADQDSVDTELLIARWKYAAYLYRHDRDGDALPLSQEVIVVAERLARKRQPQAVDLRALGVTTCGLGMMRHRAKEPGAEEAMLSGLVYLRAAAKLDEQWNADVQICEQQLLKARGASRR